MSTVAMALASISLVLVLAVYGISAKNNLASLIPLCDENGSDFNECVLKSANLLIPMLKKGSRSLDVPPLDPLAIPEMNVGQEGGAVYLKLKLTNTIHEGLSDLRFKSVNMDMDKLVFTLDGTLPWYSLKGDYTGHGKILVLPLGGEGVANFTHTQLNMLLSIHGEKKMVSNEEHFHVKEAKVQFTFTPSHNLIDIKRTKGDLSSADHMNKFIRDNSDEVLKGVKTSLEDVYTDIFTGLLRRLFNKVAYKDLFKH